MLPIFFDDNGDIQPLSSTEENNNQIFNKTNDISNISYVPIDVDESNIPTT